MEIQSKVLQLSEKLFKTQCRFNHSSLPFVNSIGHFGSVHLLSHVRLFAAPWTAARQASLSLTISCSLPKFMSISLDSPIVAISTLISFFSFYTVLGDLIFDVFFLLIQNTPKVNSSQTLHLVFEWYSQMPAKHFSGILFQRTPLYIFKFYSTYSLPDKFLLTL